MALTRRQVAAALRQNGVTHAEPKSWQIRDGWLHGTLPNGGWSLPLASVVPSAICFGLLGEPRARCVGRTACPLKTPCTD